MHALARRSCTYTVREPALEADSGRKIICRSGESTPRQYCTRSDALLTEIPPLNLFPWAHEENRNVWRGNWLWMKHRQYVRCDFRWPGSELVPLKDSNKPIATTTLWWTIPGQELEWYLPLSHRGSRVGLIIVRKTILVEILGTDMASCLSLFYVGLWYVCVRIVWFDCSVSALTPLTGHKTPTYLLTCPHSQSLAANSCNLAVCNNVP